MTASAVDSWHAPAAPGHNGGWSHERWTRWRDDQASVASPVGLRDTLSWGPVSVRRYVLTSWHGPPIRIEVDDAPPAWLEPVIGALRELLRLPPGWNSYQAQPVAAEAAVAALELLRDTMPDALPGPAIVPTARGGVQLEWHTRGIDLEIEALPTGRYVLSFEHERTGESWERDLGSETAPVRAALAELAQR